MPRPADRERERIDDAIHDLSSEQVEDIRQGMDYLRKHADQAHPVLLEAVEQSALGSGNIVLLLGEMGRPQSLPYLDEQARQRGSSMRSTAIQALVMHGSKESEAILVRLLGSDDEALIGAAAFGLQALGDPAHCDELRTQVQHPNRGTRYRVVRALVELGCLGAKERASLCAGEKGPEIVDLLADEALR